MRRPNEIPDLELAKKLVFAPRRLRLERFKRDETLVGRTPDYRVFRGDQLVAYSEIKSPRDDWIDEKLDAAPPFTFVGGARPDPTFNRIARHVAKAATQFNAVNADRSALNLLLFVNHDTHSHFADLRETLTGVFHAADGERFQTMPHISERRIGQAKLRIDLFAWISARDRRVEGYMFNEQDKERLKRVCDLMELDRLAIKA
jgi:hypothetical protein